MKKILFVMSQFNMGGIEKEFVHAYNTCLKAIEKTQEDKKTILVEREQLLLDKKEKEAKIDTAQVQMEEEELIELEGFGNKSVDNLLTSIEASKSNSLERLLFAIGINGIGAKTAKVLAKKYEHIDNLINASKEELTNIKDIAKDVNCTLEATILIISYLENIKVFDNIHIDKKNYQIK